MSKLKIALQKSGRLSEKSLQLLHECGIRTLNGSRKLKSESSNFPVELLFLRDDDIPQYVEQGVADIGIIGENEIREQGKDIRVLKKLGFANCRMALALPKEAEYTGIQYFNNKRIATSYPNILQKFCKENSISVTIEKLSGSVEIATGIGLADGIFDIVSTGSTLLMNGLKEVQTVIQSEAVLIATRGLAPEMQEIADHIIFRINAVSAGKQNKYILLNAPNDALENICNVLPGMKAPTILPLAIEGWSSLHAVVSEDRFWEVIDQLKANGAEGILVCNIEKMIA